MKDSSKKKLTKNRAKCANCGDIIQSFHVHDFVSCGCGLIFVDGGLEYLRRGGELYNIIEMCEWDDGSKDNENVVDES